MISPFAFFFYSVFNPIFHFLAQSPYTRWTTMFFLPHMILPPTLFLQTLRVLGSILLVAGLATFIICALQVYLGKIFKWGIASRGLYRYIRHPQYLGLGICGIGMAILWPRFFVLVTLALMFVLYYFLAKDEERRMVALYGASYEKYLATTGMFFPATIEKPISSLFNRLVPNPFIKSLSIATIIFVFVIGTGFLLRGITLYSLPLATKDNITAVPILPEDSRFDSEIVKAIADNSETAHIPFLKNGKAYLGYVMPVDYIMQGMIADTGSHFHLFKEHHTLALITDWVLHPFEHLRRPPAALMAAEHGIDPQVARRHHCPLNIQQDDMECDNCSFRRVILVEIDRKAKDFHHGVGVFSLDAVRTPVGYLDINAQTGKIVDMKKVGPSTAWKGVPTPEI
ncbi:MAG: isoprenylcysteine carboxylmethyltransferase family protein [Syntrophobacterales bacterium]